MTISRLATKQVWTAVINPAFHTPFSGTDLGLPPPENSNQPLLPYSNPIKLIICGLSFCKELILIISFQKAGTKTNFNYLKLDYDN